MGDLPRCEMCGGDRLVYGMNSEGKVLCQSCLGQPSIADRLKRIGVVEMARLRQLKHDMACAEADSMRLRGYK